MEVVGPVTQKMTADDDDDDDDDDEMLDMNVHTISPFGCFSLNFNNAFLFLSFPFGVIMDAEAGMTVNIQR